MAPKIRWTKAIGQKRKRKSGGIFGRPEISRRKGSLLTMLTRVEADLPAILSSDRAKRISQARKKTIAHYDMRASEAGAELFPLSEIGLKMNDAAKFMDETEPFIWDVVLLATWGSYDAAGFENRSRLYAADFWARLQGKPPVTEVD
jgi:hypothetical protein